jgi:hypothetical protein
MKPAPAKITPPFFANTAGGTRCYQAVIKSVLKYFLQDHDFSWEELDKMSGKVPGEPTWPQQMLIELHNMDFEIFDASGFDGRAFIKRGADYLVEAFGKETAAWQVEHSDIGREQRIFQKLYDLGVQVETRIPELVELRTYLQRGYLIECLVNSRKLNEESGYVGHFVLVYDIDDKYVTFHDPGLPGRESRQAPIADFEAAWASPNEKAKGFTALKYEGKAYD